MPITTCSYFYNRIHVALVGFSYIERSWHSLGGVTGFLGSLKISLCEERRLKDTKILNRKTEDGLVLKCEELATKAAKPEDGRFAFLTGKF